MTRRYKPATAIIIVTYECYLEPEDVKALDNGLFVEQNVRLALSMATRGFVLESGRLVISGDSKDLINSGEVRRVFLGN